MQYFNSVLIPPKALAEKITLYALSYLTDIADGYCLSDQALPHVTLCQFRSDNAPELNATNERDISLLNFNVRKGAGIHDGFLWLELVVEKNPWLAELQANIRSQILDLGCDVSTVGGDDYYPHLTLCRTTEERYKGTSLAVVPDMVFKEREGWEFQVGKSDRNGQYFG